jgi:hypothetical protein
MDMVHIFVGLMTFLLGTNIVATIIGILFLVGGAGGLMNLLFDQFLLFIMKSPNSKYFYSVARLPTITGNKPSFNHRKETFEAMGKKLNDVLVVPEATAGSRKQMFMDAPPSRQNWKHEDFIEKYLAPIGQL